MPTLGEYFESEARDCLAQLDRELERTPPSPVELHRAARALRGTAQMAREERVVRAASALEAATRAVLEHVVAWSDDVGTRAHQTITDLRMLVDRRETPETLDHAVTNVLARWRDIGVETPRDPARTPQVAATPSEFRAFASGEVVGIIDALDGGVQLLTNAPMDREPLKMILRRQRALLGAARLDEIPVIAEILRAVDDLTHVIAKLDVGVKREWLDIYRVAREALKAAVEPLQRDENPPTSHSLSRLRHMRAELLERYGGGDSAAAAQAAAGFAQPSTPSASDTRAAPAASAKPYLPESAAAGHALAENGIASDEAEPVLLLEQDSITEDEEMLLLDESTVADTGAAPPSEEPVLELEKMDEPITAAAPAEEGEVVPIESLLYDRDAALRRALELRDALADDDATRPNTVAALEELFDLIDLALR